MMEDHSYEISQYPSDSRIVLSCEHCLASFEIRGDTDMEKSVHIMTLLGSFEWEPCIDITATTYGDAPGVRLKVQGGGLNSVQP